MQRLGGTKVDQRSGFSGHGQFQCLVYQTITAPDGLIFHIYGMDPRPGEGVTSICRENGMNDILRDALLIDERQFYIYGDPAYSHAGALASSGIFKSFCD